MTCITQAAASSESGRDLSVLTQGTWGWETTKKKALHRLNAHMYQGIKEHCENHNRCLKSGVYKETWTVSRLFERLSTWCKRRDQTQPQLIDVGVRFRSDRSGPQMIDLLLIDGDGQLVFVEVKRQYDCRVRKATGTPEIIQQVGTYESILRNDEGTVLDACGKISHILADAFELGSPAPKPAYVLKRVPILVCRQDSKDGRDTWLKERLSLNLDGRVGSELVVDGVPLSEALMRTDAPRGVILACGET